MNKQMDSMKKRKSYLHMQGGKDRYIPIPLFLCIPLLLAVVLGGIVWFFQSRHAVAEEYEILAHVHTEKIYRYELDYFIQMEKNKLLPIMAEEKKSIDAIDWSEKVDGRAALDIIKENAIKQVLAFKLILWKAKDRNITLEEYERKAVLHTLQGDKLAGDSDSRKNYLKRYGVQSEKAYTALKMDEALYNKFKNILYQEMDKITEDEIANYYYENIEKFSQTDYYPISTIIMGDRDQAKKVYEDLSSGSISFAEAVQRYCEDEYVKEKEGILQPEDGRIYYLVANTVSNTGLQEGETGLMAINFKYYIVKYGRKRTGVILPLEKVEAAIRKEFMDREFSDMIDAWKDGITQQPLLEAAE